MRRIVLTAIALGLAGCPAYVTKNRYNKIFDEDGDGWGFHQDCAPNDPNIYPHAPDVRGDGCDADCSYNEDGSVGPGEGDFDGDDWPDNADCAPADPTTYPCAPENVEDNIDHDCDGFPDRVRTAPCSEAEGFLPEWGLDPDYLPSPTAVSDIVQAHFAEGQCAHPAVPTGGGGE